MEAEETSRAEPVADSRDFVSVWVTAMMCHLGLFFVGMCFLQFLPRPLGTAAKWLLGAFAMAAMKLMQWGVIESRDRYFWGIMFLNSLLYGLMYTLLWWHFEHRGTRRGFMVGQIRNRD